MLKHPFRSDSAYLRDVQYKDGSNLNARFQLHERFSVNKYGWHPWVFDQLEIPRQGRVLELGTGIGALWQKNAPRLPKNWFLVLSDFSPGMITDARKALATKGLVGIHYQATDAQFLPFRDRCFDSVIANHMLYHVPDREKTFVEARRVLKPGGLFYASTNGPSHLKELGELVRECIPSYAPRGSANLFDLDEGQRELREIFDDVSVTLYDDALAITDGEALVAWAQSWAPGIFGSDDLDRLYPFLRDRVQRVGEVRVMKEAGLLKARRD